MGAPSAVPSILTGSCRLDGWAIVALLTLILTFHLLTLRTGYNLVSDSAQYVMHAQNLVEGRPYGDIGYIPNPKNYPASAQAIRPASRCCWPPSLRYSGRTCLR